MSKTFINFLLKRRSVTAKTMLPSTVNRIDLNNIISVGTRVPDHGALAPWKIIILQGKTREEFGKHHLGKRFKILNPNASYETINYEENRFLRAGVVICVISSPVKHDKIPLWEMQLSSAAVCHNILISAQSLGYAAQWLTEWYAYDEEILAALGGNVKNDKISGFIYIGGKNLEPKERIRPEKNKIVQYWKKIK